MSKWPVGRRDLLKTGGLTLVGASGLAHTVEAQSTAPGEEVWSFETGDRVWSSPTVVDGRVFVGSVDDNVYALDASDGSEVWSFEAGWIRSSLTVVDGTVFVPVNSVIRNGVSVYALEASDGSEVWSFNTRYGASSSTTVVDGTVFVGSINGNLYALDASDGSEVWSFEADRVSSSPTVVDGRVFVGNDDNNIYALEASDGSEVWSFETGDRVRSSPTVVDGTVFVGSEDNNIYALEASDGSEVWSFETGDRVRSSPTVVDGTVFVGSVDDNVYALDASDGSEVWSFDTPSGSTSSPTVVDRTVFIGSNNNTLYALDAGDGSEVWSFETGWFVSSSPTVVDGTVFVGSHDERVYAIEAGVSGSSEGSRVKLGTLGHHHEFAENGPTGPGLPGDGEAQAAFTVTPAEPSVSESVMFDATDSAPAGEIDQYNWDFTGSGETDVTGEVVEHAFETAGNQSVTLTIEADGQEVSSTEVIPVAVPTGELNGEVSENSEALPTDTEVDVYAIDAVRRHAALDYVAGARETLPPRLADTTLDKDGSFGFGSVEVGEYVVLVDLPEPFVPLVADEVSVRTDEETTVSLEFSPERPLDSFAPVMKDVFAAADDQTVTVSQAAADVYLSGHDMFVESDIGGKDYLAGALDVANLVMGLQIPDSSVLSTTVLDFSREQAGIRIAEGAYHKAQAGRWQQTSETNRAVLKGYTDELQAAEELLNFEPTEDVGEALTAFYRTGIYTEIEEALDATYAEFTDELVFESPPEGFAAGEIKDILRTQKQWFETRSFAPGIVHTPRDSNYTISKTTYYQGKYETAEQRLSVAEDLALVSKATSLAGKTATATGVGSVPGVAVAAAGTAADLALSMYQLHAKNRLATLWTDSLTYWVGDLDDIETAYADILGWFEQQLDTPTEYEAIDGTIEVADLGGYTPVSNTYLVANRPEYPLKWPLPKPQLQYVGPVELTVQNTGSTDVSVRVFLSVHTGDESESDVTPSEKARVYPPFEDDPLRLGAGDDTTISIEFSSEFRLRDALSFNVITAAVWMDGQVVEETEETFFIVPSVDLIPGVGVLESEPATPVPAAIPAAGGDGGGSERSIGAAVTAQSEATEDLYGKSETLLSDTAVTPDTPRVETSYAVPSGVNSMIFVLSSVAGGDIHLQVTDEQERRVGFTAETGGGIEEIPDGSYSGSNAAIEVVRVPASVGSVTVAVTAESFTSKRPVAVDVEAIPVPIREGVFSVGPTRVTTAIAPGESIRRGIEASEIGKQAAVEGVAIEVPSLTDTAGTEVEALEVATTPEAVGTLAAGQQQAIEFEIAVAEGAELPAGIESRYTGTATITTEAAGEADIELSVLVLDTDVVGARLREATSAVTGVRLAQAPPAAIPSEEQPAETVIISGYELTAVGDVDSEESAEFSVDLPDGTNEAADASLASSAPYKNQSGQEDEATPEINEQFASDEKEGREVWIVEDGEWEPAEWVPSGVGVTVQSAAGIDGYVVVLADAKQDPEQARLGLTITDTNAPVAVGTPLEIDLRAVSIGGYAGSDDLTVEVASKTVTTTVSVSRDSRTTTTLSVPTDGMAPGEYTATVSGTDSTAQTAVVVTADGPTVSDYANADGIVDTGGLLDAVADWRGDTIGTELLSDVVEAWRSGNPVGPTVDG